MENSATDMNARSQDKTPEQIEREMMQTRESITEKVAALENQVFGNIQSVTDGVSEAVHSVKEAVAAAPDAVSESFKQTVAAVKETVFSFSLGDAVRKNPGTAIGSATLAGFLAGYFFSGSRNGSVTRQAYTARANVSAASVSDSPPRLPPEPPAAQPEERGFLGGLIDMVGHEARQIVEQALSTAMTSLKESIGAQVPQIVDSAVHTVTERVAGTNGEGVRNTGPASRII